MPSPRTLLPQTADASRFLPPFSREVRTLASPCSPPRTPAAFSPSSPRSSSARPASGRRRRALPGVGTAVARGGGRVGLAKSGYAEKQLPLGDPGGATVPPAIMSGRRRRVEDGHITPPPLLPEHEQSLHLPMGFDGVWLQLPAALRPAPENIVEDARRDGVDMTEAMAVAMLGSDGLKLVESLKASVSVRPSTSTPRRCGGNRQQTSPRQTAVSMVPCTPRNVGAPTGHGMLQTFHGERSPESRAAWTDPRPVTAPVLAGLGTPRNRLSSMPLASTGGSREATGRHTLAGATAPVIRGSQRVTWCVLKEANDAVPQLPLPPRLPTAVEELDLAGCWRSATQSEQPLDERVLAVAALVSESRPAHSVIRLGTVDIGDTAFLGMWPQLRELHVEGGRLGPLTGFGSVCASLERLVVRQCRALEDLGPLTGCVRLRFVDLQGCPDLRSLGAIPDLPDVEAVRLFGCGALPASECLRVYLKLRERDRGKALLLPNSKAVTGCFSEIEQPQKQLFLADMRDSAQSYLDETIFGLQPPVVCGWDEYQSRIRRLREDVKELAGFGLPTAQLAKADAVMDSAWVRHHVGANLDAEARLRLVGMCGQRCSARLRRCHAIIRWLRLRRIDGLVRSDFISLVGQLCNGKETESNICRVFSFLDVQRVGVLRDADFERVDRGFAGPAGGETVEQFRQWAHGRAGSVLAVFNQLIGIDPVDEFLNHDEFRDGLEQLGWEGGDVGASEIFALFSAQKLKSGGVCEYEFEGIDRLYLFQMPIFKLWMDSTFGNWEKAYKALDGNSSNTLTLKELRDYFGKDGSLPQVCIDDRVRALRLVDFADMDTVPKSKFQMIVNLDVGQIHEDILGLCDVVEEKAGGQASSFRRVCSLVAPADCDAQIARKRSKAQVQRDAQKRAAVEIARQTTGAGKWHLSLFEQPRSWFSKTISVHGCCDGDVTSQGGDRHVDDFDDDEADDAQHWRKQ
eukprot:TRINITY_DN20319_c0_g2_i3.p1 TRINITY_DN20319_c0_g2~~TRINITY_DN20319_c0_g2_i3.p1  ORF type:complete len:970 (-),score=176.19 TRINITY_DN20319_c0_g2_i3:17-2926(-)